jgi:hypothetical protein
MSPVFRFARKFGVEETDAPCDDDKVDHVAVHEALVVPVCARQMVEEEPFMRENCDGSPG